MSLFDKCYYTLEFDQSVLDFIEGKYPDNVEGFESGEWDTNNQNLYYASILDEFWTDNDTDCKEYQKLSGDEFKKLIGMPIQERYTQSELSYINQLEDRVELLESLCHDYADQINQLNHKLIAQAANIVVGIQREVVEEKWENVQSIILP